MANAKTFKLRNKMSVDHLQNNPTGPDMTRTISLVCTAFRFHLAKEKASCATLLEGVAPT